MYCNAMGSVVRSRRAEESHPGWPLWDDDFLCGIRIFQNLLASVDFSHARRCFEWKRRRHEDYD
jgi:hypothetical protein